MTANKFQTINIVDTATKLSILCRALKKEGAKRVFVCASHGLFSKNSIELIDLSPVEKVIVTDSVPLPNNKYSKKIVQLPVAPLIGTLSILFCSINGPK